MAERDPIEELAVTQQRLMSEATRHFRDLPDDIKPAWQAVTVGMNTLGVEANGVASRLEKMRDDPFSLGPDPHRAMHDAAEQGSATIESHRVTAATRLDVLENLLKAAARPSVPSDPQRQVLLRDDLRTKLSGAPPEQQIAALRAVAGGENRELAGLVNSEWGKDFRRSLGHGAKEIDEAIDAEVIRGSHTHGAGREKAAVGALLNGMPKARAAFDAARIRARMKIDAARPGKPLVGNWSGGH